MKLELRCEEVRHTELLTPEHFLSAGGDISAVQKKKEYAHVTLRLFNEEGKSGPSGVLELRDLTPKQAKNFSAGKMYTVTISND